MTFTINLSRFLIPVFCLLLLSGCGFHSVYGARGNDEDGNPVAEAMNDVAIDNIPNRNGQLLRNDLIDLMYVKGRPSQPLYHLAITLKATDEDLGIQADATSTISMINMYGDFSLKDATGKELLHGTAHSISNINKIDNQYATLKARQDAYERTINEVSQQIVNRLSLYFSEHPRAAAQPLGAPSAPPTQLPPAPQPVTGQEQPVQLRSQDSQSFLNNP